MLWFTNNILLPKDLGNNILLKYVNFCQDNEAFKNYPWGHKSFHLTVDYMLRPLREKTSNLFGFPWFQVKLNVFNLFYIILSNNSTFDY